jgi:hypothetical protein
VHVSTSTAPATSCPIDARAASLARRYTAKGDLELLFIRQIAAAETTFNSLQRALDRLYAATELDDVKIDRLTRAQSRAQRMQTIALKELKDLQQRRNLFERFPDQTKDCAPLADHFCYVGQHPAIKPIPPMHRGRLDPPLDNRPMRVSYEGGIKHLVVDEAAAA